MQHLSRCAANGGTRNVDGLEDTHSAAYDRVYADALNIDYTALKQQQDAAIAALRGGDVKVTSPNWMARIGGAC